MSDWFPLWIRLERPALIVGGGAVALRRSKTLLHAGVQVSILAPILHLDFAELSITHLRSSWPDPQIDLTHFDLVIAATNDPAINQQVVTAAKAARILVTAADQGNEGSCVFPSSLERGDLRLAITTLGASPSLAKALIEREAETFSPEWAQVISVLGQIRQNLKKTVADPEERRIILDVLAQEALETDWRGMDLLAIQKKLKSATGKSQ